MNGSSTASPSTSTSAASHAPPDASIAMPGALPDRVLGTTASEPVDELHQAEEEAPTVGVESGVRDRSFETAPKSPSARTKTSSPDAESWQPASISTASASQGGQRLSSSALAALQGAGPPARPPKSAARSQRSASIDQSVPEAGPDDAAAAEMSPDPASSPNVDSSATLTTTTPTIRAGLTHARPRPQVSTNLAAATSTARHSIASSSTNSSPYPSRRSAAYFTDDSDWTGGPTSSALETPSTTADYSASNSSSPIAAAAGKGRPPPLPLGATQPPNGELAGLGLDFLAPPSSSVIDSSARTSFDEVDLDRGMERLSQYAQTLPSPFPSVMAGASPLSDSSPEDRTLVFEPTARPHAYDAAPPPPVPPLPPLARPFVSASEPTSPASSRPLPLLGVTTTSLSVSNSRESALERLASPAVSGRAFESETDFFSTDFEAQTDADDYDEGDDSFSLYPVATRRRNRQVSAGSLRARSAPLEAQRSSGGGSLWSEDVPNWEGALPRPGDGVVDWTECRLERQALPQDTTHLILARCQTPLHIAPLLSNSIGTLSQTLVVLDIGSCGLTEIPSAIGSCCFLEELDIHGNPLATGVLPPFIGTLPALNVLLADGCNLASLPDSLAQLTRLHTLTLRNNRLRTLPAWISRLTALEQLLVDGNPFHWQVYTLVQPLLQQAPSTAAVPPVRQRSRSILSPHPPVPLRMESSPIVSTLAAIGALEAPSALSPPLASPTLFRSAAASPAPSEEPQTSRSRATSFSNRLPTTDREDSVTAPTEGKRPKWGRLLKKVSTGRLRSSSSASSSKRPMPGARTVSQPVTRDEESDVEQRSPSKSRTRPRAANRQSFLALKALGTVPPPPPQDQAAALKAVLAYLRDLDDLSPDMSLPTIPLDASSPALRHSPSLGALSPGGSHARSPSPASLRRAQSSRRVPSTGSSAFRGSRASSIATTEDSPDPAFVVDDDPKPKRVDDPVKRAAVLEEIVATEKSYLRGLQELCAIYVASAAAIISSSTTGATGKRDTVLPPSERRAVFGNVEAIRDFHSKILLPDLLAAGSAQDSQTVADQIGRVFSEHVSFMKIYSSYVNGFDDALARIQSWAKPTSIRSPLLPSPSSPAVGSLATYDAAAGIQSTLSSSQKKRIKSWLKRCRVHPAHSQISLESYLLLPIQRIPRYRMLLGTLAACTPSLSDDSPIEQAVRDLEGMATMLNESKRENEGRAQLIMWQNRLVSKFKSPLVQPHRTLLRSGAMTLVRSVKRTTTQLEPPLPGSGLDINTPEEVFTLYTEAKEMSLTGLLCNDLLVLVKMPPSPFDSDPNAPVELYTVLRLTGGRSALQGGHHRAKPPASLDGPDDLLRLKIGDKAVCYFRCAADPYKNRKEALAWTSAINLQWEVNT